MRTGVICKIVQEKNYAKIKAKSGEEVHFHEHCLWGIKFSELRIGQEVEFEMQPARKGFLGFNVRRYIHEGSIPAGELCRTSKKGGSIEKDKIVNLAVFSNENIIQEDDFNCHYCAND